MSEAVPVPSAVAEQVRAALAERERLAGLPGASRAAIMTALELAQVPYVPKDTLHLVGAWHAANPHATTPDGRCTRLAGLYGGAAGRKWAMDHEAVPAVSWLPEESATLEAFPVPPMDKARPSPTEEGPIAAGVAVVAMDTGRVLMLQRALDEQDPAGGTWEFPGGHIDDGEAPLAAARREFAEETGVPCPGMVAFDGWTSPNGVYRLFCHVVESESDVALNIDHEDRHVLNPDDPDGDCIEVYCWWDPAHAAENPALRPEAKWTPWDELANIAAIGSARRQPATAATGPTLRTLSAKAQRARTRLQDRTLAAAQVAMRDALRRAGAKVVQRASRRSNAAKAAVAAANGQWTPAVLAAVGITEQDLIRQAFDSLGERYEQWVIDAATEELDAVAGYLGMDFDTVLARMRGRMSDVATAARAELDGDLTRWAYRLLAEPEPSFGDVGEVPVDGTLPLSLLQRSLAIADGRNPEAPYGPGLLLEAWLQFDATAPVEVITWECGEPARPFPPHQELCGTTSQWAEYPSTFGSEAGDFPRGETMWFPGDHDGCQCDYSYEYITAAEAGLMTTDQGAGEEGE